MFLLDDVLVHSPSDLTRAAACEYAVLRGLDELLGRSEPSPRVADAMLERTAQLGEQHEARVLETLSEGQEVVQIGRPARTAAALHAAAEQALDALHRGVEVVVQACFFDGRFNGYADFLVRTDDGYQVLDAKLARSDKVPALLQLAAYADQLRSAGIAPNPQAGLVLGDGQTSLHALAEIEPVYRERRTRLLQLLDSHRAQPDPVRGGDPGHLACGRCEVCDEQVQLTRDLLLVAGMRTTQRATLIDNGIRTIDALSACDDPVKGMAQRTFDGLRAQAALQTGAGPVDGETGGVRWVLHSPEHIAALPPPSEGDIFFDFEGDPLWSDATGQDWGLEYLFGVVEPDSEGGKFHPYWAHDRSGEKRALVDFLTYVEQRRQRWPDMHVYHYASYEKSALRRLVGRYGACEDVFDDMLRAGVLVDLYATVRGSLLVSQRSYSIKKLEPLYMDDRREGEVTDAAASIVEYQAYCDLRDAGETDAAEKKLAEISDYNRYDCVSTWRLRDWLLARAAEKGFAPGATAGSEPPPATPAQETGSLAERLLGLIEHVEPASRTPEQQAVAMVAAAIGYHRREHKPFWWGHFDRLTGPVDEWADTTDTMRVHSVQVVEAWTPEGEKRLPRRTLRLTGELSPGARLHPDSQVYCLYDDPIVGVRLPAGASRCAIDAGRVLHVDANHAGQDVLLVQEVSKKKVKPWAALPVALTPTGPPATVSIEEAIRAVGELVVTSWPNLPGHPALDLLRRIPPRGPGGLPSASASGSAEAIREAVAAADNSYIAVQGPPGTGKTYVGSRVVAALADRGWRIGVVSQGHAAVEHFLCAVVDAGLPAERVGKCLQAGTKASGGEPWTVLPAKCQAGFLAEHEGTGCVVGGTAWDFTHHSRVTPGQLDLLVIDEAGQYSLADTIAVSTSARRLMLLGDPQQLPQVSQGTHPEPVDGSALGWLSSGHDTLPDELGYFLECTYRMHPALTAPVSALSYEGRLHAKVPETTRRHLDGVDPGVHVVRVAHRGNSVASAPEADEVVRQVQSLVGRRWTDGEPRALRGDDVLVVAPYNAQVGLLRKRLAAAGLAGVRVGTVDKFQGQQAPIVIVSMTASAHEDVPRGMSFLLNRNRLNVAISRGQWAAILVRSDVLTDFLPGDPHALKELGAFIGLCGG